MARLLGIDLNDKDTIGYALTNIKGIGWSLSKKILTELKIDANTRVNKISSEELTQITSILEDKAVEGELARVVRSNVARLQAIGSYRGIRHSRGLPSRGQRTRSNARTRRGKRKTVGSFRKEALTKAQQTKS